MMKTITGKVLGVAQAAGRGLKRMASDPRVYADVALCAVMLVVIAAAAGKSLPQLGQEALAAIASITGEGTQNALAAFTGTNTIGNATLTKYAYSYPPVSGGHIDTMSTHFACFLTGMISTATDAGGSSICTITGTAGGPWTMETEGACSAICIN